MNLLETDTLASGKCVCVPLMWMCLFLELCDAKLCVYVYCFRISCPSLKLCIVFA